MAIRRIDIRGEIWGNDWKEVFDYWGIECTVPADVQRVLNEAQDGDDIDVYINSPGGEIFAGSEIYTMLRTAAENGHVNVNIYITGVAASAASIIAMAGHSIMSPTAQMMVHCVSTCAFGNHAAMEHTAEELRIADQALSSAYTEKSGMTQEQALEMMDHETWLTAERAKELGLVDEIMFAQEDPVALVASTGTFTRAALQRMKDVMNRKPDKVDYTPAEIAEAQRMQQGRLALCRKQ